MSYTDSDFVNIVDTLYPDNTMTRAEKIKEGKDDLKRMGEKEFLEMVSWLEIENSKPHPDYFDPSIGQDCNGFGDKDW